MNNANGYIGGQQDGAHSLIVVFLRGGADGLNMVAPLEDDAYYEARPTIGLSRSSAIPLDGFYGLHPRLGALAPLYRDGALAIVHCAGSEDTTHSHFEAQDLIEHGGMAGGGWLGRYLRARSAASRSPLAAVAIGKALPESLRGAPAAVVMEDFESFSFGERSASYMGALRALYGAETDFLGPAGLDTLRAMEKVRGLRDETYRPSGGAVYGDDSFSSGLRRIAQLIKSGVGLEAASIDIDGWDSHFTQGTLMDPLLDRLGRGLAAFYSDLGEYRSKATVVVMTEFGRRVYENASFGTDHGSGSVMFVLGTGIRGGRVYGEWPGLETDALSGPGDLPVLNNYRNVLAPVLQRCDKSMDASAVFPDFQMNPLPLYD